MSAYCTTRLIVLIVFLVTLGASCNTQSVPLTIPAGTGTMEQPAAQSGWPAALPVDSVQPWEAADAAGFVIPRRASAINPNSEYYYGAQEWDRSVNALDSGDIMELDSTADTCWALYRLPLGGPQPSAISVDANLYQHSGGGLSEYWVGIADYATGGWDWRGPFTDGHTRISTGSPAASLVSPLGSLFVCVVTDGGSRVDVVGVGANLTDPGDIVAPPQVTGLSLDPHDGALELSWNKVIAADLAGYRVYWRGTNFIDGLTPGVNSLPYLIGNTTCMLPGSGTTFVRVAAVDLSGNVGPVSEIVSADIPGGAPPQLIVTVNNTSVLVNDAVEATATGADLYDWDLDGDGVFDVVGDASGVKSIYTGSAGIIRPLVRGTSGGTAVAHSAVSVIVAGNSRPVVQASVDTAFGTAPLTVNFSSVQTDFDGTIAERVWNFLGDSHVSWRLSTAGGGVNPPSYNYITPGLYNSRVKVWDDDGAWDVDSIAVQVSGGGGGNQSPVARLYCVPAVASLGETIFMHGDASSDADGSITEYAWDIDGDGSFDEFSGTNPVTSTYFNTGGYYQLTLRVTDNDGAQDFAEFTVSIGDGWVNSPDPDNTAKVGTFNSMQIVNGFPAIAYYDDTNFDLRYVRASDINGAEWETPVPAAGTGDIEGQYASMAVVNGRPAVAYYNGTQGKLYYVRANDINGDSWDTPLLVDNTALSGFWNSMQVVDGRPAIAYHTITGTSLNYARAADADGGGPWVLTPVDSGGADSVGKYASLAVINGMPSISYWHETDTDLWFAYSSTADGEGAVWVGGPVVSDANENGEYSSLLEVNGRPAISYHHGAPGVDLMYIRANNANGSSWPATSIEVNTGGDSGRYTSLTLINGYPAIGFHWMHNTAAAYARAGDINGDTWDTVAIFDPRGNSGQYASLLQVNGQPAMSYFYLDGADQYLRYARVH